MDKKRDLRILDITEQNDISSNTEEAIKRLENQKQPTVIQNGENNTAFAINNFGELEIKAPENEIEALKKEIEFLKKIIEEKDQDIRLMRESIELLKDK